jgi:TldD protein
MTTELHRAFTSLGKAGAPGDDKQLPPYFLSYSVSDASYVGIRAQYGAVVDNSANRVRVADVQVRLGDPKLDNTHGTHRGSAVNSMELPLTDDREALERTLWMATNTGYGTALDNYLRVKTEAQVRAKEEDTSPDFSQERRRHFTLASRAAGGGGQGCVGAARAELSKIFREFLTSTRTR